jgi:hypothetical protein
MVSKRGGEMKLLLVLAMSFGTNVYAQGLNERSEFDVNFSCKSANGVSFFLNLKKDALTKKVTAEGNHLYGTSYFRSDRAQETVGISVPDLPSGQAGLAYGEFEVFDNTIGLVLDGHLGYQLGRCRPTSFCYDYENVHTRCREIK